MPIVDYALQFHLAMSKAFAASNADVRLAYFDLASFYHRKLSKGEAMFPSADLLRSIDREGCADAQSTGE